MRIPALVILTLVLGAAQASAAAFREYVYLDRGVAIQFPGAPQISTGIHDSVMVKGLTTTTYAARDDNVDYRLTIVDLGNRTDAATSLLNEVAYGLIREGEVLFTDFPRVYQDAQSVYGLTLVVDRMDGSRMRTSLYYSKGRLYRADAIVLPARGDKDMTMPSRFDQTIRFPPDGRFPDTKQ
jgi:hypothetical protein